ncbi:MAG: carbohydrate-binding domain-containing protein [Bacteroidales bacterium]|nr:carbohydrate-binding domain-containing protein [Bacteroidales bacterium]
MKQYFSFLFLPLLLLSGCEKSDPYGDPFGQGNNGSYTDTPVDPVTPDTTIEDNFILEDEEDAIANTTFDRTISIVFSDAGATVSGDENGIVVVTGNDVTVNNTTKEAIRYELSGTAADGFFKIYGEKKQAIVLNGLDLTNPNGAAINNQNKKRTFVVVNGTNALADGKKYTDTPEDEDEKGALFSEAQLIFSGSGTLNVTATGKAGITSDDYVRVLDSPTLTVQSTGGHGIRGNDAVVIGGGKIDVTVSKKGKKALTSDGTVRIDGGEVKLTVSGDVDDSDLTDLSSSSGIKADVAFVMNGGSLAITNSGQGGKGISGDAGGLIAGGTIDIAVTGTNYEVPAASAAGLEDTSSSAKGIKFDGKLVITGGTVTVSAKNHEAIEAKGELIVTGGDVYATSSDDAINSGSNMILGGGRVCAISTGNDGLDANGNCYIQGALVYAVGSGTPEVAVDANTEEGKKLYVISGTLVALGGLEGGASLSQACYAANGNASTWYGLYQDGALALAFQTPSRGGNTLVVSTGGTTTLKSGVTASGTKIFGGMGATAAIGGSDVTLSTYSGGGGMGPGGMGPGGMGGPGGGPGFGR